VKVLGLRSMGAGGEYSCRFGAVERRDDGGAGVRHDAAEVTANPAVAETRACGDGARSDCVLHGGSDQAQGDGKTFPLYLANAAAAIHEEFKPDLLDGVMVRRIGREGMEPTGRAVCFGGRRGAGRAAELKMIPYYAG